MQFFRKIILFVFGLFFTLLGPFLSSVRLAINRKFSTMSKPSNIIHEDPASRRTWYPEIEPFFTGRMQVSEIHNIYYEVCGNPEGKPALMLHGGYVFELVMNTNIVLVGVFKRITDNTLIQKCIAWSLLISVAPDSRLPLRN